MRAAELKLAVGLSIELVALLMYRAVVPATQQGEIRERSRASLGPVTDVMTLAEPDPAAREAAAAVTVVQLARPSDSPCHRFTDGDLPGAS